MFLLKCCGEIEVKGKIYEQSFQDRTYFKNLLF